MLNDRELELLVIAARYAKKYRDSNPEVGFGPSNYRIVEGICEELSFADTIDDADIAWVASEM